MLLGLFNFFSNYRKEEDGFLFTWVTGPASYLLSDFCPASRAPSSLLSKSSLSEHLKHQMVNLFHSKMQGFCLSIEIKAQGLHHLLTSPHTLISFTVLSSSTTPHTHHLAPVTIVSLLSCECSPRAPAIADPSAATHCFPTDHRLHDFAQTPSQKDLPPPPCKRSKSLFLLFLQYP